MAPTVTFIVPYFGKKPGYFDYFCHSASFHPGAEFVFLTDCLESAARPANVRFVPFTLSQFNERVSALMGRRFDLLQSNIAKICDLKPAFGELFPEYLKTPFWGYCDVDLVFGNASRFFSEPFLDAFDVVSLHGRYLSGSCTLWRNVPWINGLYRQSPDWERVFLDMGRQYYFDECGGALFEDLIRGKSIFDLESDFVSMTHLVRDLERKGKIRAHFRDYLIREFLLPGDILRWAPGELGDFSAAGPTYQAGASYAYFHFVNDKSRKDFFIPPWRGPVKELFIDLLGFHANAGSCTSSLSRSGRKLRGFVLKLRDLPKRVRRRLGRYMSAQGS